MIIELHYMKRNMMKKKKIIKKIEINIFHSCFISLIKTMNVRSIFGVFKRTPSLHVKMPLGRWNVSTNHNDTMLKIKYATEDNCGFS